MEVEDSSKSKAYYANTLGYMYYYGRGNGGVPQYEEAFKWFSMGAAGGVYESRYKICDMLSQGLGIPKDELAAAHGIWDLYYENLKLIREGHFDTKFADIALRAGRIKERGIGCEKDMEAAYYHYLQARYAIKMRMALVENYGDEKVAANIEEALTQVYPQTTFSGHVPGHKSPMQWEIELHGLRHLLGEQLGDGRRFSLKVKSRKDDEVVLVFKPVKRTDEKYAPKMFLTIPEAGFCGMAKKLVVRMSDVSFPDIPAEGQSVVFDDIDCSMAFKTYSFTLYGETVAFICGVASAGPDQFENQRSHRMAVVQFRPGGESHEYLMGDVDLKPGDEVRVPVERASDRTARVAKVVDKVESELALPLRRYGTVIGRA